MCCFFWGSLILGCFVVFFLFFFFCNFCSFSQENAHWCRHLIVSHLLLTCWSLFIRFSWKMINCWGSDPSWFQETFWNLLAYSIHWQKQYGQLQKSRRYSLFEFLLENLSASPCRKHEKICTAYSRHTFFVLLLFFMCDSGVKRKSILSWWMHITVCAKHIRLWKIMQVCIQWGPLWSWPWHIHTYFPIVHAKAKGQHDTRKKAKYINGKLNWSSFWTKPPTLFSELTQPHSNFSLRLIPSRCTEKRFKHLFVSTAIQMYSASCHSGSSLS